MKKASNILYLIGGIYAIVSVAALLIAGVILLIFSSSALTATIIKGIEEGTIHTSFTGSPEEIAVMIQITFLAIGITFIAVSAIYVIAGIIAFKGRNNDKKNLFVANIVFGVITENPLILLASIFALIKGDTKE